MKKKSLTNLNKTLLVFALSFCSLQMNAQMTCGTQDITPEEARALVQDLETFRRADVSPTGLITVPFQAHIVRTDAGTGGPNATTAMNNIIAARTKYLAYNITLDILPINYIDETDLMVLGSDGIPGSGYTEGDSVLQLNNVPNVVNAYFVDTAYGSSGGAIGGYARFPWNLPNDYFVVVNNSSAENGATVAHEMGHYFGLLHTFETANGAGLVNGTNCDSTGDLLCDTPADGYDNFGDVDGGSCAYTSGTDSNGDSYVADATQIMSYNQPFSCVTNFSADADTRMRFYMGKEDTNNTRAYLFQPTAICNTYSAVLGAGGTVTITGANIDNSSSDPNGDTLTLTASPSSFTCSDVGDHTVTLTAEDPNGFTNSCTTTVTVSDNVALSAICQSPTIALDGAGLATITTAIIDNGSAVGNCGLDSEYLSIGAPTPNSLNTTFSAGSGSWGNMFDLQAVNDIIINSFDVNIRDAITSDATVYYKTGSYVGSEATAGDWTLVGTVAGITSSGTNVATPLNLNLGINVTAGDNVAFYITLNTNDLRYTPAAALGSLYASDANLNFYEGAGLSGIFGATFSPRVFNGNIHYTTPTLFDGNFDCSNIGPQTITLNRRDNAGNIESCDATVTIEDAQDPSVTCPADYAVDSSGNYILPDFYVGGSVTAADNCGIASVVQTPTAGTSLADGVHVISYLATDNNGRTNTNMFNLTVNDNTLSVDTFELNINNILLTPNPATDKITLTNESQVRLISAELLDLNGRIVKTINLENMESSRDINLSQYANGIYLMRIASEKGSITKRIVKY